MNVLIVVPWDQTFGGVAGVVNNLARQLVAAGHRVTFFHANASSVLLTRGCTKLGFPQIRMLCLSPLVKGMSWRALLASLVLFPSTLTQLLWMLRRERIDVVNVHYAGPQAFFPICRFFTPIKLVTSVHGADIFPGGVVRDHYSWAMRLLLNRSDVIVANSQSFREDFLGVFPHLRNKTTFIHNGVDWAELHPPTIPAPPEVGPYVLCVAAHNQKKALDVLLHAFAKVVRKNAEYKLMLVGDGPLRADLEKLAAQLQLNERVIFAGALHRGEVVRLLHGCTVFVLPSRSEPFGIAMAEAMACGKPVVGSRIGGIPEIVDDGQDGLLVEPDSPEALAEALERLLIDTRLRTELGSRAWKKVRARFLWDHTAIAYERLYEAAYRAQGRSGKAAKNRFT